MDNHQEKEEKKGDMIRCSNCDEANEKNREFCWACYSPLNKPLTASDRGVLIRKSYLFVPEEHGEIKEQNNTKSETQRPKVELDYEHPADAGDRVRSRTGEEVIKIPARDIKIFKGSNLIAVRIDGKNYTSEDTNVPPDVRLIMRRVEAGESIIDIESAIKYESATTTGSRNTVKTESVSQENTIKSFFENFSTIIIVGLILILLFELLMVLKNCG